MLATKKARNKPKSKMALLYLEAEPHLSNHFKTLPEIDISMTYYDWADIHVSHIQDHPVWFRNTPLPFSQKRNITFINTGCYGHRVEIIKEMKQYIQVDCLGPCEKNMDYCKEFPLCCKGHWAGSWTSRYREKECLIYNYKFVMALENTITPNYTTEKFWQPLKMGSVPIYWGSDTSKILEPGDNSVIRVNSFSSIKELVEFIEPLLVDEEKYNRYLEWKGKPFNRNFMMEAKYSLSQFVCNLADAVATGQQFYGSKRMPKDKKIVRKAPYEYQYEPI